MLLEDPNKPSSPERFSRRYVLGGGLTGLTSIMVAAAATRYYAAGSDSASSNSSDSTVRVVDGGSTPASSTMAIADPPAVANTNSYGALLARHAAMLTSGDPTSSSDPTIAALIAKLDADAKNYLNQVRTPSSSNSLWKDDGTTGGTSALPASTEAYMTASANRARQIAIQFGTPGSTCSSSTYQLGAINILQWIYDNRYNQTIYDTLNPKTGSKPTYNWWDYRIGTPLAILDALVTLGANQWTDPGHQQLRDNLLSTIFKWTPDAFDWGANLAWTVKIVLLHCLMTDNGGNTVSRFNDTRNTLSHLCSGPAPMIAPAPTSASDPKERDGFRPDSSFVQHGNVACTGSYGIEMYFNCAWSIYLLAGAADTLLPTANWDQLVQWTFSAFEPFLFRSAISASVMGRAVARYFSDDHSLGRQILGGSMLLSGVAAADRKTDLQSFTRTHILSDVGSGNQPAFFAYDPNTKIGKLTVEIVRQAAALTGASNVPARSEPNATTIFPLMDRAAHRRPGFAMAWSMYSPRIVNGECLNGENLRSWYTGWGMTAFSNAAHPHHYQDDFWPTVDPYRLPGVTLDKSAKQDGKGYANATPSSDPNDTYNSFAGGASVSTCGVVCQGVGTLAGTFSARKSWIVARDYVIFLGSAIRCTSGYHVETIIENRNLGLNGAQGVSAGFSTGAQGSVFTTVGATQQLAPTLQWLSLDDVGGYVLVGDNASVSGLREDRTGKWSDIDLVQPVNTDPVTRRYATIWFDHGVAPTDSAYSYVFIPNATPSQTATFARNSIPYVKRTDNIHYARCALPGLMFYGGMFWAGGNEDVIATDAPVAITVLADSYQTIVAVSDPSQLQKSPFRIVVSVPMKKLTTADAGLSVSSSSTTAVTLQFSPEGLNGATQRAVFSS